MTDETRIKTVKLNLEHQLNYLNEQIPHQKEIPPQDILEQVDVADCYLIELMNSGVDIKDYESKLKQIKKEYGVSYFGILK